HCILRKQKGGRMKHFIAVCVCLLVAGATFAQVIPCPVPEAHTEIVTPIPSPWWQTPQVGRLTGTSIETIGGKTTLVCKYWAYGTNASFMRLPPKGKQC